ncbi:MAG: hypothetical protein RJA87_1848 [Pseudomonadota bacterium]|jgi:hypothetical protein
MLGIDKSQFSRLVSTRFRFTDKETGEAIICELEVAHPLPLYRDAVSGYRLVPLKMDWVTVFGVNPYQALQLAFQIIDPLLDSYRSEYDIEHWCEEP